MGITINVSWEVFHYRFKRYTHEKFIDIRELLESLALDCFNNYFTTEIVNLEIYIPLIDKVNNGYIFSTCCALHFPVTLLFMNRAALFMTSLPIVILFRTLILWLLLLALIIILKKKGISSGEYITGLLETSVTKIYLM